MRGRGGGRALVAGVNALAGLSAPPAPLPSSETKLGFHRPGAETTFAPGAVSGAAAGRGSSAGESCPGLGAGTGAGRCAAPGAAPGLRAGAAPPPPPAAPEGRLVQPRPVTRDGRQ